MREPNLTHSRVLELFDLDAERGVLTRKVRTTNSVRVGDPVGTLSNGYLRARVDGCHVSVHRLIWFYVNGVWPVEEIDHINGIKSDNRIANLREASRSQNNRNCPVRSDSSTGLRGVCWNNGRSSYRVAIRINGRRVLLGTFHDAEQAHAAYVEAAKLYHGDFANCGVRP